MRQPVVACFATQGTGTLDEQRIVELLTDLDPVIMPFDRSNRVYAARAVLREIKRLRPDLVVMEGSGIAGGLAVMAARVRYGVPYVVSSGDAIGPFLRMLQRGLGPFAGLYERLLCRLSAGYVGWSPYLVGRALTFGAPRAMTAAGWARPTNVTGRRNIREELGIPSDAIVFGIAGSIEWNQRVGYCYGHELLCALQKTDRADIRVLVVGDGSGLPVLERLAADELGRRVLLPGRVPHDRVSDYLEAMDVGSLPQSLDQVGALRYTTKLSEYLEAGLPIVTGQIPLAYDLEEGWIWRLPRSPWERPYQDALGELMATVTPEEIEEHRSAVPRASSLFSRDRQQHQVAAFIHDVIAAHSTGRT